MVSQLYQKYFRVILWAVALSAPYFCYKSETLKSNNDIETWMPRDTGVRQVYEQFKQDFGAEESILIGINTEAISPAMIEAIAGRIERLPGIRQCWTPQRMISRMAELGVSDADAHDRIEGLVAKRDTNMVGIVAMLSDAGLKDRMRVVQGVRDVLAYCQLNPKEVALTGPPVIISELDALGNPQATRQFFLLTVAISLGLLYYTLRHWGMALGVLGISLWSIYVTQTGLAFSGGEMNFILGSLSVMVMIFTLSISVHFISYYADAYENGMEDPLQAAFKESWKPCILSTVTTLFGLCSLNVSSIRPVAEFGFAAAFGSIVALVVGLGLTPALLVIWPEVGTGATKVHLNFGRWADMINHNRYRVLTAGLLLVMVTGVGIMKLRSYVEPAEFLPKESQVFRDLKTVEQRITNIDSIEAVLTFPDESLPFLDQLAQVREVEAIFRQQPGVRHVLSLACFFPSEVPDSPFAAAKMLQKAQSYAANDGLTAEGRRLWRFSIRVQKTDTLTPSMVLRHLEAAVKDRPIYFTGMTPLLDSAQKEIFDGFWQSFTAACVTISLVMILSLRNVLAGLIAMIPNIIPIWLVFGGVGFAGVPVDIGMMMTGSIALGISVDCTFHFLVRYRDAYNTGISSAEATKQSLQHSGEPMLDSTLISSLGMLALCLSSFTPTARFGFLMALQMLASLLGELVILPAILCCRPARSASQLQAEADAKIHPLPVPRLRTRMRHGTSQVVG